MLLIDRSSSNRSSGQDCDQGQNRERVDVAVYCVWSHDSNEPNRREDDEVGPQHPRGSPFAWLFAQMAKWLSDPPTCSSTNPSCWE
jgi:hypothetical protein